MQDVDVLLVVIGRMDEIAVLVTSCDRWSNIPNYLPSFPHTTTGR
jgi:hypothetical protein